MTYNEWRDELKQNLLCVSESERRRVLDYYAEAYADRREAGFSEREIIQDFGAPYDAAQRILAENKGEEFVQNRGRRRNPPPPEYADEKRNGAPPPRNAPPYGNEPYNTTRPYGNEPYNSSQPYGSTPPPYGNAAPEPKADYTWVFVLLCVIFAIPLFSVIMTMVFVTVSLCVAPIGIIGSGVAAMGSALGIFISGEIALGFYALACGIIAVGVGIMLCPLLFKLVTVMWKLFRKLFGWIKSLFSGRRFA